MYKKIFLSVIAFTTLNIMADYPIVRPCCTDGQAYNNGFGNYWFNAGPDRVWREENIAPDSFTIYRRSEDRPISFTDLAEQPAISGFERSVYTTPK
jgi:hypothetical protein